MQQCRHALCVHQDAAQLHGTTLSLEEWEVWQSTRSAARTASAAAARPEPAATATAAAIVLMPQPTRW